MKQLHQLKNLFDPQPPFPVEDVPLDYLRCSGELVSVLGAAWFFYKEVGKWNLVRPFTQTQRKKIKSTRVTPKSTDNHFQEEPSKL